MRSTCILKHFPSDLPLILKTTVPPWFFENELHGRSYEILPEEYDCGAIQLDGIQIDPEETLSTYQSIHERNQQQLEAEVEFLRQKKVRLVVSDIPSLACRAAHEAGIPSVLVANFTWVEIYQGLLELEPALKEPYRSLLDAMREEYALATLALITPPAVAMDLFPRKEHVPMVARHGRNRREEVVKALGLDPSKKLYLFYVGHWGLGEANWKRLEKIDDSIFLTLHPLARGVSNLVYVEKRPCSHVDLTASCDAVIGKPGYGLVGECLSSGTPLLYTPREEFVEYFALHEALQQWGGGIVIPRGDFYALNWRYYLQQVDRLRPKPPIPLNGAEVCARKILEFLD